MKIVLQTATLLLLVLRAARAQRHQRGVHNTQRKDGTVTRDLIILKRRPFPYDPGSPDRGCMTPNTFFDAIVGVTMRGNPQDLDAAIFMDLEESFQEAYNGLRSDLCDQEARKVTDATVDESSINIEGPNEFSLLFDVRMGCDSCAPDTPIFEPDPNNGSTRELQRTGISVNTVQDDTETSTINSTEARRRLAIFRRPPLNGVRGRTNAPTPRPTLQPATSPPSARPTPRPTQTITPPIQKANSDQTCCPPNGERRGPYASEFVDAFDSIYKAVRVDSRSLQVEPIEEIINAIEIASVGCDEQLEDFDAEVFVELGGNPGNAANTEIAALEASFRTSYNSFNEVLCDPLFRTITGVTAEPDERFLSAYNDDRRLQRPTRFKYKVNGRCRGCGGLNQRLFAQGSAGRRELEMKYDRHLQFVFDQDSCFCGVGTEERGIFEDEFTVAYDNSIQELRAAGIVENVETVEAVEEDVDPTFSPTTSPTNNPTAPTDSPVPSPSPSKTPTASPTDD